MTHKYVVSSAELIADSTIEPEIVRVLAAAYADELKQDAAAAGYDLEVVIKHNVCGMDSGVEGRDQIALADAEEIEHIAEKVFESGEWCREDSGEWGREDE